MEDLFHAHIGGMDVFARALIAANEILTKSDYKSMKKERYSSFDSGVGKEFESGNLSLTDLYSYAGENQQLEQISGKQERYENLVNRYLL